LDDPLLAGSISPWILRRYTRFTKWFVNNLNGTQNHRLACWIVKASRPQNLAAIVDLMEKEVKGRKRQILVDTNGLLLRTLVHTADMTEGKVKNGSYGSIRRNFLEWSIFRSINAIKPNSPDG
jgi:hypothetical protein